MELKQQCCTLEQAKRLQELGVKAEATFYWMPAKSTMHWEYIQYGWHGDAIAPAYNVAELGEMMPKEFTFNNIKYYAQIFLNAGEGFSAAINKIDWFDHKEIHPCIWRGGYYQSEAQIRAAMLVYLLENNLIQL